MQIDPAVTDPSRSGALRAGGPAAHRGGGLDERRAARAGTDLPPQCDVGADEVTLELRNRRAERSVPGTGVGRGALAYRATAVGGSATSGPGPDAEADVWRVLAQLPVRAPSVVDAPEDRPASAHRAPSTTPPQNKTTAEEGDPRTSSHAAQEATP